MQNYTKTKGGAVVGKKIVTEKSAIGHRSMDPEGRQSQLCALAIDLAEQQLRDGTASSQVITHYLKLATAEEKLKEQLLEKQVELAAAKTEALQSAKRIEELYANAMNAMRKYSGQGSDEPEDSDI